jgi:polyisoprenyl-teichoic acid--peptidoglycan teichoic acid transferase
MADMTGERGETITMHAESRHFRRAVTLLLLTLVAPGSAQYVAGNQRVGRFCLRVLLGVVGVLALLALLGLVSSSSLIALLSNTTLLRFAQLCLLVLAVGWLALFVDAWRLGTPLALRRKQRLTSTVITATLSVVAVTLVVTSSHYVAVARDSISAMFAGTEVRDPYAGRYNILLLGTDAAEGRPGLRPDSITLASIDEKTGRTALFSFPRNLQGIRFPAGTVMRKHFPKGFNCGDECLLNAVYTWATDHKDLFPAGVDPGIQATKDAIRGVTGLDVSYYALIDLHGFQELIDAVGGITIDVKQEVPYDLEKNRSIKTGRQTFDGKHALLYARSRTESSDYDRMARQRCVMAAMLHQLDPTKVLLKFREIAQAGKQIVATDIPASELDTFVDLAMRAKRTKITSVQFVPPLIKTAQPDFDLIQAKVREAIDVSKKAPTRKPSSGRTGDVAGPAASSGNGARSSGDGGAQPSGGVPGAAPAQVPDPSASEDPEAHAVKDLSQVCAVG